MYLSTVKQIVDTPIKNNKKISSAQLVISNGFSIVDIEKNSAIIENSEETHMVHIESDFYEILNYIPFDINAISVESETSEIPNWFKNRAMIWHQGKLGDRVFFDGLTTLVQNGMIKEN